MPERFSLNGSAHNKRKPTLAERDKLADQLLSTRYDNLNQVLAEAEKRLKMLKPLHPIWVDYERVSSEYGPTQWELLGMARHEGKWRLCHAYDNEHNDDSTPFEMKPIVECNVDVRVRAAKVVRQLHEQIVKSKEEYIPAVDEAIKQLTELCKEI